MAERWAEGSAEELWMNMEGEVILLLQECTKIAIGCPGRPIRWAVAINYWHDSWFSRLQSGGKKPMSHLSRTGVSLEDELLHEFDRLIGKRGTKNRRRRSAT